MTGGGQAGGRELGLGRGGGCHVRRMDGQARGVEAGKAVENS